MNSLHDVQVLKYFLTEGHNPENDDWYSSGSFYADRSETEIPIKVIRPSQPPIEAFESPFLAWPMKTVFKHFKDRYYEPFKDLESGKTLKSRVTIASFLTSGPIRIGPTCY